MTTSPTPRPPDRVRLAAVRAVRRSRGAHRTRGDMAYLVYITALVGAIVGVPVVRTIALALSTPDALTAAADAAIAQAVAVVVAAAWWGAWALGRVRGPIAPSPFVAAMLSRSDIAPHRAWARRLTGATAQLVLGATAVAALAVSGLLVAGTHVEAALLFVGAAAAGALPLAALWLAGQVLRRRASTALGAVLTLLLALTVWLPDETRWMPATALASLWPGAGPTASAPLAVALTAALAAMAVISLPLLLARLIPATLEEHAQRWETMTVLATTGDLSGALDRTRSGPTAGRRLHIGFRRPLLVSFAQRDLIGGARSPLRTAAGLVALAAAGAAWAWIAAAPSGPIWVVAIGAGLLTFVALGSFSDGFHEAADTAGRPALYGRPAGRMLLLHLPVPLVVGTVIPALTAWLAGAEFVAVALVVAVGVIVVAVRAYDATKGPLPIELLMPVPTPVGDASAFGVWAWQTDALLWVGALSFVLSGALSPGASGDSIPILLWLLPALAVLAALTASRLRRAAG